MKFDRGEVFAAEIGDQVYHVQCVPSGVEITNEDLIMRGNEETDLYFCDGCGKEIT